MKFVKRISLFFIYPMTMFAVGFAANMAVMEYFYPGSNAGSKPNSQLLQQEEYPMQVSVSEEPVVHADTRYVVQFYDAVTGEVTEKEEIAPDKYMGLTREKLALEIDGYNENPSLSDLEKGFSYIELVSFSPAKIVVRKSYESKPQKEEKGFFLLNEDHLVVVYDHSLEHVYMTTDISVESLPTQLQEEILHMKFIEDEGELFNFLESYSS